MPTPTYDLISERTLGLAASSVTFSSIPGTYKDLVLECVIPGISASGQSLVCRPNAATTNLSFTNLAGNGTAASSLRRTSAQVTYWLLHDFVVGMSTTEISTAYGHFMSYANSSVNKTMIARSGRAGAITDATANLWQSTSAITSIDVFTSSGANLNSGSTFRLWGIA